MSSSPGSSAASAANSAYGANAATTSPRPARNSIAAAVACFVVAASIGLYAALGGVDAPVFGTAASIFCLALCGAALLLRERRSTRALAGWKRARPLLIAFAVPLSFYLIERPSNEGFLSIDPYYILVNLCVLAALFALVYALGQQSRAAVAAFLAACFIAGAANHYVILFKGQPVVPADLFALSTAASVGSGYSYLLDARLLECIVMLAGYCTLLAFVPKVRLSIRRAALSTTAAFVVAAGFGIWITSCNLEDAYGCTVDVWGVKESYAEQGTALCFLKRAQDLSPTRPEGYDAQTADELLAAHAPVPAQRVSDQEPPSVIAIMNETFADLSRYPRTGWNRGTARCVLRHRGIGPRCRRSICLGAGRRHMQQRVRVPHRLEHGPSRRRRVSVRALRPRRHGKPRVVSVGARLRHPRRPSGRSRKLAP